MADINERLDRLQRREEFDRFGRPLRDAPTPMRVAPLVARPAGVDDRLGEVLDAVASVVCRHPGMSVMVALADGQAGRPVIRVSERDGSVDTGVVVVGSAPLRPVEPTSGPEPVAREAAQTEYGPYDGLSAPAAAPTRESVPGSDPVFEPALRDGPAARATRREELTVRDGFSADGLSAPEAVSTRDGLPADRASGREELSAGELAAREPIGTARTAASSLAHGGPPPARDEYGDLPAREGTPSREPDRDAAPETVVNGRHAVAPEQRTGAGRSGSSWHDALWSPESRDRFRQAEQERRAHEEGPPPAPASSIPLPEDTSQVVSRLAQLLRENPTLAANWSREAQE